MRLNDKAHAYTVACDRAFHTVLVATAVQLIKLSNTSFLLSQDLEMHTHWPFY